MNSKYLRRPAIGTCLVLLIPLVMTILDRHKPDGDGWRWGPGSFVVMGALLFSAGYLYERLASKLPELAHRVAVGGSIMLAVLAIWSELAVDAVSKSIRLLVS
jgi:protein-S-isoprenylcysteine O-methyltransferase Ste14